MSAEDELVIPEVPEAKPDDPEDVSWALSTAEAMWARGDHLEGIKWVRKAAEAASEAEDDLRALHLAKAAADLASMLSRRSLADQHEPPPAEGSAPSAQPSTARSAGQAGASGSRPAPRTGKSAPPLPSKASQPPPAPGSPRPAAGSVAPPRSPAAGSSAPRPLAAAGGSRAQGPAQGKGVLTNRTAPADRESSKRGRRRSRDNLDEEAQAAGLVPQAAPSDTAEVPALESSPELEAPAAPSPRARRASRPKLDNEATVVAHVSDITGQRHDGDAPAPRERSVAEWDASPTQDLTGPELDHIDLARRGESRETSVGGPPIRFPSPADLPGPRPPTTTIHDPEIQTSQAVRVVVWRDASGVHIAPSGTVVSSITIDAVLVALEPSADLTAWLSHKDK